MVTKSHFLLKRNISENNVYFFGFVCLSFYFIFDFYARLKIIPVIRRRTQLLVVDLLGQSALYICHPM